ncbi:MAG: chemotaxis protein CheA [Pirellulaceae bacterium]
MSGNEEFVQEFLVECEENLDQLDQDLIALEEHPSDPPRLASIFRTMHTIKGTSGFFAFSKLGALAHAGENLLGRLRDGHLVLTADIATALLELVDAIRQILASIERTGGEGERDFGSLSARLTLLAEPSPASEAPKKSSRGATQTPEHTPAAPEETGRPTEPVAVSPPVVVAPAAPVGPRMEPDTGSAAEPSARPVGAASEIPHDLARAAEEAIQPLAAERDEPLLSPAVRKTAELEEPDVADAEPPAPVSEGSVRVDVGLLNQLMNQVGELVLARNQIRPFSEAIQDRVFAQATQQLDHITSELQEGIMKTRMQPIGNLWSRLPRVVRDLARSQEKLVQLEMHGRETELDRTLIEAIKDPLTHLVRNAVDHGIEAPAIRLERGKPETGQIVLSAYHEGGLVNIEISDDGAGIDSERVREKSLRMGLITRDQAWAMTDQQVKQLIFSPGLSTAERVTDISGRGVGMDVVKTNIERIGGSVAIDSRMGQGTTLRVKIPLTLAIIPALIVVTRGERFAIPQVSLREIVTFQEGTSSAADTIGTARVYRLRGELLPLVDLREVLHLPSLRESGQDITNIMVLQAVGQRFGLIVDRVRNTEEIVVKPLHKTLARLSVFSGATIMGDGRVALILDVVGLARIAGVVDLGQDAAGQSVSESEETEEVESDVFDDYLVCDIGRDRQVAVSLPDVARLEEVPVSAIQTSTGQPVVPYRNHIMPLLRLERTEEIPASAHGTVPVVVHSVGRRHIGLMVNRIVDIATADQELDTSQRQTAIRGRTLIGGRVLDIVDMRELARACGVHFVPEPAGEVKR